MRRTFHLLRSIALTAALCLPACIPTARAAAATDETLLPREVRAVWLTTLSGLDWPSRPATTPAAAEEQRRELCGILDRLQAAGINTVLFQARIRSTTAYASVLEPWDEVFTGTPGKAPGYDPLRFVTDECHRRGMNCTPGWWLFPSVRWHRNAASAQRRCPAAVPTCACAAATAG